MKWRARVFVFHLSHYTRLHSWSLDTPRHVLLADYLACVLLFFSWLRLSSWCVQQWIKKHLCVGFLCCETWIGANKFKHGRFVELAGIWDLVLGLCLNLSSCLLLVVFAVVLTETNLCEFLANHFREISEQFVQEGFYGTSLDVGKFKLHGQT